MARKRDDEERIEKALAPDMGLTSEKMDTNSIVKSVSSAKTDSKATGKLLGEADNRADIFGEAGRPETAGRRDGGESLVALDNPDDVDTYLSPGGDRARRNRGGPGAKN